MLADLKRFVMKPAKPRKTDAETLLEQVEQGQQDRAQRLADEQRAREEAERQATIAQIRADDAAVRQLIAQHRTLAQAFEAALGRLATVAGQVSETQARIDRRRAQVWTAQRELYGFWLSTMHKSANLGGDLVPP
jgi:hypothetical protein